MKGSMSLVELQGWINILNLCLHQPVSSKMNLSLSFVIFFPSSSCIIDLVDFPNFVKKFVSLGLQGFLRNIWNYSRLKWLNEILWDVYFPNVNYWDLLTHKFHLHLISQSHLVSHILVASLQFLLTSLAIICPFAQLITACSQGTRARDQHTSLHKAIHSASFSQSIPEYDSTAGPE